MWLDAFSQNLPLISSEIWTFGDWGPCVILSCMNGYALLNFACKKFKVRQVVWLAWLRKG